MIEECGEKFSSNLKWIWWGGNNFRIELEVIKLFFVNIYFEWWHFRMGKIVVFDCVYGCKNLKNWEFGNWKIFLGWTFLLSDVLLKSFFSKSIPLFNRVFSLEGFDYTTYSSLTHSQRQVWKIWMSPKTAIVTISR